MQFRFHIFSHAGSLDYSALSLDLTLDSSETHQDFPVTILSDMDYELMESFSLSLSLLGVFPSVILRPHTALVEITDDDGMCSLAMMYCYSLIATD